MLSSKHPLLSSRAVSSMLALAVVTPSLAKAAEQYTIYAPGLYDASTTSVSHVGLAANGTVLASESLSNFSLNGAAAGTEQRYVNSTSNLTLGNNAWYYDPATHLSTVIGFVAPYNGTTASNTKSDGTEATNIQFLNASGVAAGRSAVYLANGSSPGYDTWVYTNSNTTTTAVGLYDSQPAGTIGHMGSNGNVSSSLSFLNANGQAIGSSNRYDGTNNEGLDAWYYNGNTTLNISLTAPQYNNGTDGETAYQQPMVLNNNGQVGGYAYKYLSNGSTVNQAFVYDASLGTTVPVNLANATYGNSTISYSATTISNSALINNLDVSGTASSSGSTTVFLYNFANQTATDVSALSATPLPLAAGVTGNITYFGTNSNGTPAFFSSLKAINASGQAIGSQSLYNVGLATSPGQDTFFYDGNTTIPIGLTDYAHTGVSSSSGNPLRSNSPSFLTDSGQVAGTATIYSGTSNTTTTPYASRASIGTNAWVFTKAIGSAQIIGLPTSYDVYPSSGANISLVGAASTSIKTQTNSGLILGTTTRYYSNGTTAGSDGFLYTPGANGTYGTNAVLGLTDVATATTIGHVSSDGVNKGSVSVFGIDALGLIAGTSQRFLGTATAGQDAWVYNLNSNTTYTITLSTTSTGNATSSVSYIGDNGVVLGTYTKYDTSDNSLGTFAYAFEGGQTYDLGAVTTNLTAAGWQKLASAAAADTAGDIQGSGTLAVTNGTTTSNLTEPYILAFQGLLGDANLDGKVDLTDLNIVLNNLGTTTSLRSNGNFDGAATIDLTDLNDVLNNLGTGLTTNVSVGAGTSSVPEPASLCVLTVGGLALMVRRRSIRNHR